jgi:O-antigen/teichoic acid export membrane protein
MVLNKIFKLSKLKKNLFFNLIFTLSNILFPILTFPYVSRVLGPSGIGKVQFVNSFVQYFVFLAALGIPIYGIREIAKVKDNVEDLKKTFSTLIAINIITSLSLLLVYFATVFFVPSLFGDFEFYLVASLMLLVSFCSIDWFFSGIEQFKFIAFRSIVVKTIFLFLLYYFVLKETDTLAYLGIIIGSYFVNNFWNLISARNYLNFKNIGLNDFKKHFKPLLYIFSTVIAASIYSSLDVILLGFLKGFNDVGYYSSGAKFNKMCIPFLTAMSIVLLPQIASGFKEKNHVYIKSLLNESLEFVILLGVPMTIGLALLAPEIILLFSGDQFIPSILSMQISAPVVLIIGVSTIYSIQILTPASKDKENAIAAICGLFVSLILNFILIPYFGYLGATIANLMAEFTVMLFFIFFAQKVIKFHFNYKLFLSSLLISLFFIPIVFMVRNFMEVNKISTIILSIIFCGFWYISFQMVVLKNKFLLKHITILKNKK